MNPAHPPRARSLASRILRDLGGVAVLAIASLAVGLMMNRRSPDPIPSFIKRLSSGSMPN